MFPGVDGFHWTLTHILFLTIFALVLSTVAVTAVAAALRTVRKIRRGHSDRIRWKADFEDLPGAERACRHAITGTAPGRVCPNALDCRVCDQHAHFAALDDPFHPAAVAALWAELIPRAHAMVARVDPAEGAPALGRQTLRAWHQAAGVGASG